jgi:hypothetical protein
MGLQATEVSGEPPVLEPNDVASRAPSERFSEGQSDQNFLSFSWFRAKSSANMTTSEARSFLPRFSFLLEAFPPPTSLCAPGYSRTSG